MATHIKKASFHGISVFDKEIKLSQLADDTTIFVKNSEEVESVINCIGEFSEISGLKMNKSKSVLFSLKDCSLKEIKGIPIKDTVTYLGIVICKDLMQRNALHFEPIIEKIKNRYNAWLMRDLSLLGRILLSKAEGISRSVYVSMCHERWGWGLKCRGNGSFNNNIKQRTKTTPKGKNKQAGRRLEHSQTQNSHVTYDTRKTTDQHRTADTRRTI